jgi:hypothetical protein
VKRGDKVRVRPTAIQYPGRIATVLAETAHGELVEVEFEDEAVTHSFCDDELEIINDT